MYFLLGRFDFNFAFMAFYSIFDQTLSKLQSELKELLRSGEHLIVRF